VRLASEKAAAVESAPAAVDEGAVPEAVAAGEGAGDGDVEAVDGDEGKDGWEGSDLDLDDFEKMINELGD